MSDKIRELGEVINYAIAAYKKSVPVEKIFTVGPTDANGYLAAFIVTAIETHFQCDDTARLDWLCDDRNDVLVESGHYGRHAEWIVRFNSKYGRTVSESDLRVAIDGARLK